MNKKELKKIADAFINANLEGFDSVSPVIKEVKTESKEYAKSLKSKKTKVRGKIFSFTYVKSDLPFKSVAVVTMTEEGKIVKTSKSG